jgi:type I restriction enzyme S subunit
LKKWDLPKGWEWKKLGSVCEKAEYGYTTSASQKSTGPKFLRTTDISSGKINWGSVPYCSSHPNDEERYSIKNGDILISRAGSVGASMVITNPPRSVFASYLIRFRPKKGIDSYYLGYFLKSNYFFNQLVSESTGTTLKGVNATNLSRIELPVPSLETQKKIVAILEKAEEIKHLRAKANAQTQKLIQSVFLDMFGDPMKNTKNFEKRRLGDLVDSIKKVDSSLLDQFHYIDIDSVDNYLNIISNPKIIAGTEAPSRARQLVRKDDILFSTVRPYLKNIAIVPEYLDGQVASTGFCIIRSKIPEFVPFLFHLLLSDSFVDSLKEFYRGANYPAISPKDLMDYRIPFPSIDLLVKFNSRSRQIDTNLKNQRKFLNEMTRFDELLTSKAFTGELVA